MANSDDDVREIQLSGKQLVFLFMAVTVVSVVIFLCGVLVGRGVQARVTEPVDTSTAASSAVDESADPTASTDVPATPPSEPTAATGLVYEEQLAGQKPPAQTLRPRQTAAPTAPKPAPAATPTPAPAVAGAPPPAAASTDARPVAFPEPRGDGFAIQVAALTGRAEAEAVAARLKGKGYAVYLVVSALPGQSAGFKVRVGKFKARAEAEKIALRLEREEQFKPWITR